MQNHRKTLIQILLICGSVFAQSSVGQKIDGVAAVVGDRVVLMSDVNQSLAMAVFQQKLDPRTDGLKIQELKDNIINTIVNRKVILIMDLIRMHCGNVQMELYKVLDLCQLSFSKLTGYS